MEAATLPKKKTSISKGKVKRTIKNVLCRPDPIFWPNVSEEHAKILEDSLSKLKIEIPEFKKLHWKDLKTIPKDQRPKQPKIKRIEGLILGLLECTRALQSKECSAVIIESSVNPRTIVQPLLETCISMDVPVLCLNDLKKVTANLFGIPSCCLGIKNNFLIELFTKIRDISKAYKPPKPVEKALCITEEKMDVDTNIENNKSIEFSYLYRPNKKTRIFNPSIEETKAKKAFIGQDFIEFSNKSEQRTDSKAYMSMIVKRIGNNQNKVKRK